MSTDTKTLQRLLQPVEMTEQNLIDTVTQDYDRMKTARHKWEAERAELLSFIGATDTKTTTNASLPFKNSTTINKISQLKSNLVTSYIENLIPNQNWIQWEGFDGDSSGIEKQQAIQSYVRNKIDESNAVATIERIVDDYITSGISIAFTRYVNKTQTTAGGVNNNIYTGTEVVRVDPMDFVFDVTASSLESARKCIRAEFSIGELKKRMGQDVESLISESDFQRLREDRVALKATLSGGVGRRKYEDLKKAGFGDRTNYIEHNTVEVLQYFGDFYDFDTDELLENYEIVVVDRRFVTRKQPVDDWLGTKNLHVSVWEFNDDSLSPIGPLARVVGLQYKLDKLENLKADIYDKFADPERVEIGDVRHFGEQGAPGSRYEVDEGGDVRYLLPPHEVLRFETQIPFIMNLMEELSGSPKEALGQRTPGEKTKFEVQLLDQGQSKLFRRKVKKFESELLTPILQDFLVQGRKNLDGADLIRVFDNELGINEFIELIADDLQGSGRIRAKGASIFAERANALQNINTLLQGGGLSQMLNPHVSRKNLAQAVEQLADLKEFNIFFPNIGIQEDQESQRLAAKAQDSAATSSLTGVNVSDETSQL